MAERWYEDFAVGDELVSPAKTITESEVVDWAFRYDPQPFHMDKPAAAAHMYGGLIASGWQVAAIAFRLLMMTSPWGAASLGSPGVDELRWQQPVRPDDTIHVRVRVTATRVSRSRPDRGLVHLDWAVCNQHGDTVMSMKSVQLLRRKPE